MSEMAFDIGGRFAPPPEDRVVLGSVAFDNVTMAEAIERIAQFVEQGKPRLVVTPNVDHLLRLQKDQSYAELVARADLVLVDSQPLVRLSRLVGRELKERVAGSDLFPRLCGYCARAGYRVFFLGGDPGAAEGAAKVLKERYPDLQIAGTYCPPHGFERSFEENWRAVEAVRVARPDVVFVGLGSPKQENWIASFKDYYGAPVSIGIGISFSFVAGHVKRAPVWMQRAGFEWLHRLVSEPRRLCGRYMVRGLGFLPLIARELWMARRGQPEAVRTARSEAPAATPTDERKPSRPDAPRRRRVRQARRRTPIVLER